MAKALFISPHPDDEVLSMGMGILNHLWNGHVVYLYLVTKGGSTSAIDEINGKRYCSWHEKYHDPAEEIYARIGVKDLKAARALEFKYSAACLGVKQNNIRMYDIMDGSITKDAVKNIIEDFIKEHGDAMIKTTSYLDAHPDHRACGEALLELYNAGIVKDARFYVSPEQWQSTPGYYETREDSIDFYKAALSVYKRWNPRYRVYGVGYHSVPSLFDTVFYNTKSKYHIPNEY